MFLFVGGDSKAVLIANVNPSNAEVQETIATLNFASRARSAEISLGNRDTIKKWRDMVILGLTNLLILFFGCPVHMKLILTSHLFVLVGSVAVFELMFHLVSVFQNWLFRRYCYDPCSFRWMWSLLTRIYVW